MKRVTGEEPGGGTTLMGKVAFGSVFFPEFVSATGTLAAFATFVVAFFTE